MSVSQRVSAGVTVRGMPARIPGSDTNDILDDRFYDTPDTVVMPASTTDEYQPVKTTTCNRVLLVYKLHSFNQYSVSASGRWLLRVYPVEY